MRLLYLVTEDGYFCSHRLPLALAAQRAGFEVTVATRVSLQAERIRSFGLRLEPIGMQRTGGNVIREVAAIAELVRLYRRIRPDVVHHVAMKPVLYGSLAARLTGVPRVINALAGLGYVFTSEDVRARFLRLPVELSLRALLRHTCVVLQNRDDLEMLSARGVVARGDEVLIRGSGVDLNVFEPRPEPPGPPVVLFPARLLRDKGVLEFVEAARALRGRGVRARFVLAGQPDPLNPSSVTPEEVAAWQSEGIVESWGWRNDMPEVFAAAHLVCLPSYREGLPKALIEAMAAGRPIVATDVPGCREAVIDETNGLLVPARTVAPLVAALDRLIRDGPLRQAFGDAGRRRAEAEFGLEAVVDQTLRLYR